MCCRCHTETGGIQVAYKLAHETQDLLNKTQDKVENIIRKFLKQNRILFLCLTGHSFI